MGTFKIAFKPEVWKMEEYVAELSIPQNFLTGQVGDTPQDSFKFPACKRFTTGTLSRTPVDNTFFGSFSRKNCMIEKLHFYLPEKIGNKILTMKPFKVELLANNTIVGKFVKEFSKIESPWTKVPGCFLYSTTVALSTIWKNNVDLIRIIFNIHAQESHAEFVENSQSKVMEMLDKNMFATIKKEMIKFHNSDDFSDATIRCGTDVIHVHKCILALASPVFRTMFGTEMKEKKNGEVMIEDIEPNILELLIKWIYTGTVVVDELQDQMDLFKAAHKYQIETLKNFCIAKIFEQISLDNVLEMYEFGESYQDINIMEKTLILIKKNKDKVFNEEEIFKEFVLRYPKLMLELVKG